MTTTVSTNAAASASASGSPAATPANSKGQPAGADFMSLVEALNAEEANPAGNGQGVSSLAATAPTTAPMATKASATALPAGQAALEQNNTQPGAATVAAAQAPTLPAATEASAALPLLSVKPTTLLSPLTPSALKGATVAALPASANLPADVAASAAVSTALPANPASSGLAVDVVPTGETDAENAATASPASATPVATADTSSAVTAPLSTATLIANPAKGLNPNVDQAAFGTGQKLPAAKSKDTDPAAPEPLKSPLDTNALTQAAALTVTATPLVVPLATPVTADKVASQPLGAQFSLFTSTTANSGTASATDNDEADDDSDDAGAAPAVLADNAAADTDAPVVVISQSSGQADSFGQSKFSNEVTQVLSLAQAGIAPADKADKTTAVGAASIANDNVLASAGLTLTRQDNGQSFVTTLANATTAASPLVYQAPVDQVSVIMQRAAADQTSAMTINLNPVELGRVEISLKFGKDGSVQANVMADKAGTLDLLKSDQTTLHQALENAGLNPDSNSLSFSLRDDQAGQGQQQNFDGSNSQSSQASGNQNDADSLPATSTITYAVQNADNGHVNFFA